jgi:hydrogenase/urease accessory protein HupE
MKFATILITVLSATAAQAHPGHMAEVAGHGHWLGAAALGAAIAIGLWAGLKARKDAQASDKEAGDEVADDEVQEA